MGAEQLDRRITQSLKRDFLENWVDGYNDTRLMLILKSVFEKKAIVRLHYAKCKMNFQPFLNKYFD